MITRQQKAEAQRRAADLIRTAGLPITEDEAGRIEVADFGLSNLEKEGAQILTLVQTDRIGAKVIALLPGQALPEHWHPPMGADPGKEETVRLQWGTVLIYVDGPDTQHAGRVPAGKEQVYSLRHELVLQPADQIQFRPGQKHWFLAGAEGAVVFSFSSVARDVLDMFTDPEVERVTEVKE
ncbi:MAG TPA: D-lyxose/D-mannose family sugar isomerase [Spirochaetia bacterium]|nr:D-lyxose/D-mannose family sugar isomerase [Spirochaetia bacterium]